MKAIAYTEYGSPEVLRLTEVPTPTPKDGEVLVRVRAAAVNPLDWHFMRGSPRLMRMMSGWRKPRDSRLGVDVAGHVEAVGKRVTQFRPGDDVFGAGKGAFAEYTCVPERNLVHKPANITFEQAAAVPVAALTALQGLRNKGRLRPGQRALINGAAGGVGTFAVQIGKVLGAHVTGVCSSRNVDLVRSLGADQVIDYTRADFTRSGQQFDVILDMIGNHSLADCRRVMSRKGTLLLVGSTDSEGSFALVKGLLEVLVVSVFVPQRIRFFVSNLNKNDMAYLRELLDAGKIVPVVDRSYALSEVPEAIRHVEAGHARGKIVITV